MKFSRDHNVSGLREGLHNEWFACECVCQIDCALAHSLPKSEIAVNIEHSFLVCISVKENAKYGQNEDLQTGNKADIIPDN